ncbi:NAD(P)(+)--arginine ADP-ribosyltransferase 2-like [Meleagris gallopavo]|uniref:NAD(P)(+)--arginine ADP-ribosyltransferase 2-like n=1 Tax=Meleagris gallopavo TaxID=9103 RepID=UPI000549D922|nr:NAD(P)(+)--arginine ADP-ribosyltransferase 2-like [Meleagris gallopavo]
MELLALCWVLLAGTLLSTSGSSSALREGDLDPITVPMDMAPHSFDDQYEGCGHMMWGELQKVNYTEFTQNYVYANGWRKAAAVWQKSWGHLSHPPQLRREQAIAVLAYTAAGKLYQQLNAATRRGGRSHHTYLQSYHFKTLHFLLTQALQALRKSDPNECYNVYRGVGGIRFTAEKGRAVRFGQFTSTSLNKEVANQFGRDTFFEMKTCHGVPIKQLSFFEYEDEVLIPPFEVFEITNFSIVNGRNQIHLKSKEKKSNHNCELLKRLCGQWGQGHLEVGLGLSPGPALHSLGCSNCSWWGSGHREGDPIPAAL